MSAGVQGYWKPFQTGIIISTQSLIELTEELLNEAYNFVMPHSVAKKKWKKIDFTAV